MTPTPLSQCIYHARRITKLVHMWDKLRGPGMAMPPEEIDSLLSDISLSTENTSHLPDEHIAPLLARIQKTERILLNTLTDQVYLNDDRDREIIVARIAVCNTLKKIRALDPAIAEVLHLWEINDGDEWATV